MISKKKIAKTSSSQEAYGLKLFQTTW